MKRLFSFKNMKVAPVKFNITYWPIAKKNKKLQLVIPYKPLTQTIYKEPNFSEYNLTSSEISTLYIENENLQKEFTKWKSTYIPGPKNEERTIAITVHYNKCSKLLHADYLNMYIHTFSHPDKIKDLYEEVYNILPEKMEYLSFSVDWYQKQIHKFYMPIII